MVLIQMAAIKTIKTKKQTQYGWGQGGYHTNEQHTTAVLGERSQKREQTETKSRERKKKKKKT